MCAIDQKPRDFNLISEPSLRNLGSKTGHGTDWKTVVAAMPGRWMVLSQIPKLGNRPYSRSEVLDFIGSCADKRADLPGNYFVPFV